MRNPAQEEPKNVHIVFQYARIASERMILSRQLHDYWGLQQRFAI